MSPKNYKTKLRTIQITLCDIHIYLLTRSTSTSSNLIMAFLLIEISSGLENTYRKKWLYFINIVTFYNKTLDAFYCFLTVNY